MQDHHLRYTSVLVHYLLTCLPMSRAYAGTVYLIMLSLSISPNRDGRSYSWQQALPFLGIFFFSPTRNCSCTYICTIKKTCIATDMSIRGCFASQS